MSEEQRAPWPTFRLVFPSLDGMVSLLELPHGRDLEAGVPETVFQRFSALERAFEAEVEGRGRCIAFGQLRRDGWLLLDPVTGEVVASAASGKGPAERINRSLADFVEIAQRVVGRFPFYSYSDDGDWVELAGRVSRELCALIREVDPEAQHAGALWERIIDDVAMGDYGVEDFQQEGS